jgi:hypothetical protein
MTALHEFDWLLTLRLATLAVNVVFMVLFPFVVALRPQPNTWQLWTFVTAVELAWLGDCIQVTRRIIFDSPWDWLVSPFFALAGFLAVFLVLIPAQQDSRRNR